LGQPLAELVFELMIMNLLKDICITGFINFEGFATVWAFNFIHSEPPFLQKVISLFGLISTLDE
jgi:hypothetical protein